MARYLIFEKTRTYDYKFKGSSSATNGDKAIKNMKMKGTTISTQFMKYQLNPKTEKKMVKGILVGRITTWKKPR